MHIRLTKFGHSCVLVETDGAAALFDPGNFSWESGTFNLDTLERLDDIIITHGHPDHFHLPFVQAVAAKFPDVNMIATDPVAAQLKEAGFQSASTTATDRVKFFSAPHESMEPLSGPQAPNNGVHYLDVFSDPGDSHSFSETKAILALPVTAPWGTMARAAAVAQELRPRYVLPVHDWFWKDALRVSYYERLRSFCEPLGITFLIPTDGDAIELDI